MKRINLKMVIQIFIIVVLSNSILLGQRSTDKTDLKKYESECSFGNVDLVELSKLFFSEQYRVLKKKVEYYGYDEDYYSDDTYTLDGQKVYFEATFKNDVKFITSGTINGLLQTVYKMRNAPEVFKFKVTEMELLGNQIKNFEIEYYGQCVNFGKESYSMQKNDLYRYIVMKDLPANKYSTGEVIKMARENPPKNLNSFCNDNSEYCAKFAITDAEYLEGYNSARGNIRVSRTVKTKK